MSARGWSTCEDGAQYWVTYKDGSRVLMVASIDAQGVVDLHHEEFDLVLWQVNLADYDGYTFEEEAAVAESIADVLAEHRLVGILFGPASCSCKELIDSNTGPRGACWEDWERHVAEKIAAVQRPASEEAPE